MPMIATTIINSIRVKPCWMERFMENSRLEVGVDRPLVHCRRHATRKRVLNREFQPTG
jgi:hypothetical protein